MPNCCFNILVIGRIGCGKKMLVNSLLGEDILPPSCLPSNTIISVVKYGYEKQIFTYLNQDYSHKINDNFTKSINSTISPSTINEKDVGELFYNHENVGVCNRIEFYCPSEILKDNITITVSSGFYDLRLKNNSFFSYTNNMDLVLFVLSADVLCSIDEMKLIEYLNSESKNILFVINKFDILNQEDKEAIQKYAKMTLGKYTNNEIVFVSAFNYIQGKIMNIPFLYDESEIPTLIKHISSIRNK